MSMIQETIDVEVPLETAYNQWTQFEEFPRFMHGVEQCRQIDSTHLWWVANIGGVTREWGAEIVEQVPNRLIAWRSVGDGAPNAGAVSFEDLDSARTRVHLAMEFVPNDLAEQVGDTLGFVRRRIEGDLERFKHFIEERGIESGAWRGEVQAGVPQANPLD